MINGLKNMSAHTERKRGRPPKDERLSPMSVYLPSDLHDKIAREAVHRGQSVSVVVREILYRNEFHTLQK